MTRAISKSDLKSSLSISIVLVNENFGEVFKQVQDILIHV